jgi:hypothetical protein
VDLKPRKRTPFSRWMWEHGLRPKDLEKALGRSWESVRKFALDFDDPARVIPPPEVMDRIVALTAGAIRPGHFYEPPPSTPAPDTTAADEDWHSKSFLEASEAP